MRTPPNMITPAMVDASIIPRSRRLGSRVLGSWRRKASSCPQALQQVEHLAQTAEIEEVSSSGGRLRDRWRSIVSEMHGDGGMGAIGQTDDDVRLHPLPDTNHDDLLAVQRVIRMRNRY